MEAIAANVQCYCKDKIKHHTGLGKSRFIVVSTWNTKFILVLFTQDCLRLIIPVHLSPSLFLKLMDMCPGGCWSTNPYTIAGSIPSQGTYPGCGFGWGACGRQPMDVSLSLPSSCSKSNKKMSSGEDKNKINGLIMCLDVEKQTNKKPSPEEKSWPRLILPNS